MYVDTATYVRSGKTHKRYLLRTSYRENGKVKKKTIASLCSLTQNEIDSLKLALKHKSDLSTLSSIKSAEVRQGKGKGAVEFWAAKVRPGKILFEIDGVSKNLAMSAFELASAKLPIKCKFIKRI